MHVRLFGRTRVGHAAGILLCAALAAGCGDSPTESRIDSTFLSFQSISGDWVGQGQARRFTAEDGDFTVDAVTLEGGRVNGVQVQFYDIDPQTGIPLQSWHLGIRAPGTTALRRGTYEDAVRFNHGAPEPGLSFSGNGRGCGDVDGEFTVHELVVGADRRIERLHVTFVQRCEGTMPPLNGELAYVAP